MTFLFPMTIKSDISSLLYKYVYYSACVDESASSPAFYCANKLAVGVQQRPSFSDFHAMSFQLFHFPLFRPNTAEQTCLIRCVWKAVAAAASAAAACVCPCGGAACQPDTRRIWQSAIWTTCSSLTTWSLYKSVHPARSNVPLGSLPVLLISRSAPRRVHQADQPQRCAGGPHPITASQCVNKTPHTILVNRMQWDIKWAECIDFLPLLSS